MSSTTEVAAPQPLAVEVRADPHHLPDLRDRLTGWLRVTGVPTEFTDRLVLATNEAVTNAVAHAYQDGPAGIVRVTAEREKETITVKVTDHGSWRPALPTDGRGGRGVLIMQECVDRVLIDKSSHGTTVTMQAKIRDVAAIPDDGDPGVEQHRLDVGTVGGTTVARSGSRRVLGAAAQAAADGDVWGACRSSSISSASMRPLLVSWTPWRTSPGPRQARGNGSSSLPTAHALAQLQPSTGSATRFS